MLAEKHSKGIISCARDLLSMQYLPLMFAPDSADFIRLLVIRDFVISAYRWHIGKGGPYPRSCVGGVLISLT